MIGSGARLAGAIVVAGLAVISGACSTLTAHRPPPPTAAPIATTAVPAAAQASFVGNALAMLGQPYRYGGAAPGGFDCSGLVAFAGSGAGLRLPRTAREQLQAGAPVARAQVQAGDLVFMHLSRKVLHVGIALDAHRFVHAPATGRVVRIDSLTAAPYARSFIAARRIVDATGVAASAAASAVN